MDTKNLKSLTESILKSIEREDYKKNSGLFTKKAKEDYKNTPAKFTLNENEKQALIDLYKANNPSEFIFRPAK